MARTGLAATASTALHFIQALSHPGHNPYYSIPPLSNTSLDIDSTFWAIPISPWSQMIRRFTISTRRRDDLISKTLLYSDIAIYLAACALHSLKLYLACPVCSVDSYGPIAPIAGLLHIQAKALRPTYSLTDLRQRGREDIRSSEVADDA